jgi:hypothetical protein
VTRGPGAPALALAVLLCGAGATRAHDPITTSVTFAREIRAILAARCVTCHAPGGSAPMPLTTFEEVRPWARAIKDQILTRGMPKWHAARGFGAFRNDSTLTPFEQTLLVSWIDGGLPEGTPARTAALKPVAALPQTETSSSLSITIPARADVGRMAVGGPHWITGWTFSPGDPLITAAVISLDGVPTASWVAGDRPTTLPAGIGFRSAGRIRVDVRTAVRATAIRADAAERGRRACPATGLDGTGRMRRPSHGRFRRCAGRAPTARSPGSTVVGGARGCSTRDHRVVQAIRSVVSADLLAAAARRLRPGRAAAVRRTLPCGVDAGRLGYGTSMTNAAVDTRPAR